MDKAIDRRKGFKTPPIDVRRSQEARRAEALQEQKRKRANQIDASRQLDQFAGLSLGASSGEDEVEEQEDEQGISRRNVENSPFEASNLLGADVEYPPASRSPSPYPEGNFASLKGKKKRRRKGKKKVSEWANKCMYAELLEMREDTLYTDSWDIGGAPQHDGLPDDLETAWVGLGPLPVGKRCLAVTMQGAGLNLKGPNTTLRSRLMGKVLIHPFPSPLPPNTILDCILDENWRTNGLLHVLDVIRWKSQDVGGCEASFRFWWRDTRLSEIKTSPHPAPHRSSYHITGSSPQRIYRFPYPTTLVPVPYLKPDSLHSIITDLIPQARSARTFNMKLPVLPDARDTNGEEMQIDFSSGQDEGPGPSADLQVRDTDVTIKSDGLLLYVGEASYESGESPLSVWLPCEASDHSTLGMAGTGLNTAFETESPLSTFEKLVRRRLIMRQSGRPMPAAPDAIGAVEIDMA